MCNLRRGRGQGKVVSLAIMVVSVVIAIVVAQRLMGMSGVSPPDDGLEILNISCLRDGHMNWRVSLHVLNPGDSSRSLSSVLVNDMEVSEYGVDGPDTVSSSITTSMEKNTLVHGGETAGFYVWIGGRFGFLASGTIVDITVSSLSGLEMVKSVILP